MKLEDYQIVKGPLVTEKSTGLKQDTGVLCFKVDVRAGKLEIKHAIERLFKTKVQSVRTVHMKGKLKRRGRTSGYRADWKKAYVTLSEGQKPIEYFEGV